MSAVSRFSTFENYQSLQAALSKVNDAIHEAELAKQAGIPQAEQMLTTANSVKERITAMMSTYFPNGEVPAKA